REGDDVFSDSTRELGNSVRNACEAILSHRPFHLPSSTASAPATNLFSPSVIDVTFVSVPANAVVTITGQPIGRTPFTTRLPQGIYKAVFSVDGYQS
ncbi:PEGA domain-containing protein, partial [Klebsiella pneumoniae]|uniref:PEGA domain-containing protein n=1 Tax=Klebsiella pneumoniae TaxID=573 RepID=UPI003013744F